MRVDLEAWDWAEAFDVCRERNRPLVVYVQEKDDPAEVAKIFPSGRCETIAAGAEASEILRDTIGVKGS